jgi:hypothetical protein
MSVPVPEVPLRVPVESVDSQVVFRDNIGSDAAKLQLEEEKIAIRWPAMKEVEYLLSGVLDFGNCYPTVFKYKIFLLSLAFLQV